MTLTLLDWLVGAIVIWIVWNIIIPLTVGTALIMVGGIVWCVEKCFGRHRS